MQSNNNLANAVAIILHPLLLPIYCTLLVIYGTGISAIVPFSYKAQLLLNVGVTSCILPLIVISLFIRWGRVVDIEMRTLEERPLPLIACALVVTLALTISRLCFSIPKPIVGMELGLGLILGAAGLISHWWQISLHCLGAGALFSFVFTLGTLTHNSFTSWAATAFIVAGLSAWSRLAVGAHTPSQLLVGYLLGITIMNGTMSLIL